MNLLYAVQHTECQTQESDIMKRDFLLKWSQFDTTRSKCSMHWCICIPNHIQVSCILLLAITENLQYLSTLIITQSFYV